MNKKLLLYITPLLLATAPLQVQAAMPSYGYAQIEPYEGKPIGKISVQMETLREGETFDPLSVINRLRSKEGDPFSQYTFDQDLKSLSEQYDRIDPHLEIRGGKVDITLKVWQKPVIKRINWDGNKKFSSKKLLKELDVKSGAVFNRDAFNQGFNKLKEMYIKKGYFEAQLSYTIFPDPNSNEVTINIKINEGRSGHISRILFKGLSKKEEGDLLAMINTKKYNFLTSWLSGTGIYHEEALEHDKLVIVNYLQNEGYADAKVELHVSESKEGRIIIQIDADKGNIYKFGDITISGNDLFSTSEIKAILLIHDNERFSPEKLRETLQNIKTLYGSKGYIEANVQYALELNESEPVYNVHFEIQEGEQYRIGIIRVLGNVQTNSNVILRESILVPGEIFDTRKLQATQMRLQSIGYFKSVNVYAVRSSDDQALGPNYRDVNIEVDETTTGNLSLFFGFSTVDDLFGGLDLTENNFNYKGLGRIWKDGLSAVRGGGEYAHARVSIGQKQTSYLISWMTPYYRDTMWRIGFDVNYSHSRLQSKDYDIDTIGLALYGSYPLTPYWTWGWKSRFRNAIIRISKSAGTQAREEEDNSGIVLGLGLTLNYDSTDNPFKPHRGYRSLLEGELAGVRRHASDQKTYPFVKLGYLNTYYYPIWKNGIFKTKADFRFIVPFAGNGDPDHVPLSERFFLGGETSVRGYRPFSIGPSFKDRKDPTGGISSVLLSVEYLHEVFKLLDLFAFFDAGSISLHRFDTHKLNMSYGAGARIDIGNKLPLVVGIGFPINPDNKEQVQKFFFAMGGQF